MYATVVRLSAAIVILTGFLMASSGEVTAESLGVKSEPVRVLRAELTQGGYLIGQVSKGHQVSFLEKPVKVNQFGQFIIGFGRDFQGPAEVMVVSKNEQLKQRFEVAVRDYRIERIDGLPKSKVSPKKPEVLARIVRETQQVKEARSVTSELEFFKQIFISPAEGRISGYYGSQRVLNGEPKRPHFGEDIAAPVGTPVVAPASGKVVLVHPDMFYSGATIIIDHGLGLNSTYLHLHKTHVKEGQSIKQGELIGEIGQSGRATGPHLDWRLNWHDQRLDPALFVKRK
ncbi:M23 family metallopeptidase [Pleionea litopenaei]|uniref:M23 family metallopeptidase n=1 Tax=Pleionea litopenaei TaxID=3070815 RepID=A0AA51X8F0_9GAMM|nr:M23 family metallopeptidase [Pleionea sp. HL-JVS1]WMS88030.1 M23 family metallopeptidase [Pleionea sp. HL-JVS1]